MTGFGRMQRKEDARFIRGRGTFTDDVRLPGMLHGAILRSPHAHARIVAVDTTAAQAHPRVCGVWTGRDIAPMATLAGDTQDVLAVEAARFQGQEIAFVVAEDPYSARDAIELIDVSYEPLEPLVDARRALDPGAPAVRDNGNKIFDWDAGDEAAVNRAFARADVIIAQEMLYPRVHPAPLETCGVVADYDTFTGKLTLHMTSQAPHVHRTVIAAVTGMPEHKIRVISPDVGGGFGNKVPLYPGYVCAIFAARELGRPVKWMEDRSENLMAGSFARDYHMRGEIAATNDGTILALRAYVVADHGAFNGAAQPSNYPAGFFSVFTGSYDIEAAYCKVTGVHTNKAPGGVAYSCSFRITEAVYLVERLVDILAHELGIDPAKLRLRNLLRPGQFPHQTPTGWVYDSGDYPRALRLALDLAGYAELRKSQAEQGPGGIRTGIGISFFTEAVGAGPREHMDMAGLGMADGSELTVNPDGTAVLRISAQTQGQGHETTFAQIVAEELGLPAADVEVVHGDSSACPFGLGTYGSRSTPVSGAAAAVVSRRVRAQAREVAATMLEVAPADLEFEAGRWSVRGDPDAGMSMREIARAAYSAVGSQLTASAVYSPPNLTFPFGAYVCVVDVDTGTGMVRVRRFIAVDDCGVRINPMIVEGQIHRGLADGIGMALMQVLPFDEAGNCLGGSFMDYMMPTAMECPSFELGETVTPSPHHPFGAKGVGESATVGSVPAVVNAVMDALAPLGVVHADIPLTPAQVWRALRDRPFRTDLAIT